MSEETTTPIEIPSEPIEVVQTSGSLTERELRRVQQESFLKKVLEAKREISDTLKLAPTFKIAGRSIEEWQSMFKIVIPNSPGVRETSKCMSSISANLATINLKLQEANLAYTLSEREYDSEFSRLFVQYKSVSKSKPESNEMASMKAEADLSHLKTKMALALYIKEFWKSQLDYTVSQRKMVESLAFMISADLRANFNVASGTTEDLDDA
jgi:hypothetical protein